MALVDLLLLLAVEMKFPEGDGAAWLTCFPRRARKLKLSKDFGGSTEARTA
jgi:hypothetical protein